jgi:hypothetical protein
MKLWEKMELDSMNPVTAQYEDFPNNVKFWEKAFQMLET